MRCGCCARRGQEGQKPAPSSHLQRHRATPSRRQRTRRPRAASETAPLTPCPAVAGWSDASVRTCAAPHGRGTEMNSTSLLLQLLRGRSPCWKAAVLRSRAFPQSQTSAAHGGKPEALLHVRPQPARPNCTTLPQRLDQPRSLDEEGTRRSRRQGRGRGEAVFFSMGKSGISQISTGIYSYGFRC